MVFAFRKARHAASNALPKQSTTRRNTAIAAAVIYAGAIVFLILVEVGNTHIRPVLTDTYFLRLDTTNIMPTSVANAELLNSVARGLGLRGFYQVGLWNFCEGYQDEGVTYCSTPESWFWFNPVQVLVSELLAGATITPPSAVNTVLAVLRVSQQTMFGFFLIGLVLCGIQLLATPLVLRSRLWSLPLSINAAAAALCINSGAVLASLLTLGAKAALAAQTSFDIGVQIGLSMFVLMWLAAGFTSVAFLLHAAMGCFCRIHQDPRAEDSRMEETKGQNEKELNSRLAIYAELIARFWRGNSRDLTTGSDSTPNPLAAIDATPS